MDKHISINKHSVHLWRIALHDVISDEMNLKMLLCADEVERAMRFKFDIHRQRFIATRALLRQVLSAYTQIPPQDIDFIYGNRGKPFLRDNPQQLQFNVSHSDDMAVIGVTMGHEIGVDIEKIEPGFKDGVARRFFSAAEYDELMRLPADQQVPAFYAIWSKKEALIKALGEGLYAPLDKFSVTSSRELETVSIVHEEQQVSYHVQAFSAHDDYAAAFATDQEELSVCFMSL